MEGINYYLLESVSGFRMYQYTQISLEEIPSGTRFNKYGYSDWIGNTKNCYRMSTLLLDHNGEEVVFAIDFNK
jgi:hypothetical protein